MDRLTGSEKLISRALENPLSIYDKLERYEDLEEKGKLIKLPRIQEFGGNAPLDINPKYVVVYLVLGDVVMSKPMCKKDAELLLARLIKTNG